MGIWVDTAGPFVHGRKVGVQITGVAAAAGDFFTGCGNFAEGVGVVGDIGDDNQYVHAQFVGEVFGSGDGHTRGGDTFYRRVVGQVDEHNGTGQRAGTVKVFHEEVGFFEGDTYRREYDGEAFAGTQYLCLTGNLRRQLGMGQAGAGEYRQFLAADQGVQSVDGADAGLNEFGRIVAGGRVHRPDVRRDPGSGPWHRRSSGPENFQRAVPAPCRRRLPAPCRCGSRRWPAGFPPVRRT